MVRDKEEPIGFQTVDEWHKEMAVNLAKWIGWKLLLVIALLVVL